MNRDLKFKRVLHLLEECSESVMYFDEINLFIKKIRQVSLLE